MRQGAGIRVVVIGAGMAGILATIRLKQAGIDDVTVYEKADSPGGTWRENTYPGIACDVPAYLYSYSFAPNPEWSHAFAPGAEINAYFARVATEHDVDRHVTYGTEVNRMEWDDAARRWHLTLADGTTDAADVVIAATGVLHHPRMPDIDGLDTFAGACFHSARWDHSVDLGESRLGVVGTGSSAVQIVSAVAGAVPELHLFQRTPQWILPIHNPEVTDEQKATFREHPEMLGDVRADLQRTFTGNLANLVLDADSPEARAVQQMCRANLDQHVADEDLRARLTPTYRAACKRLLLSEDFYEAVQRPGVEVVTEGIDRVEPDGVRTCDGRLHELDVLVLATGFRVDRFLRPIEVVGRGGVALDDLWAQRPSAYLAVTVPHMPNLFLLNGPNGPVGNFSLIDVAEAQMGYVMGLIGPIAAGEVRAACASAEAAERFETERAEATRGTIWVTGCRSWYLDDRGVPMTWPWTFDRFLDEMRAPRLGDFELT
jgi:cation diffusion facilitator CzcD-associated flavoprotein CzcO